MPNIIINLIRKIFNLEAEEIKRKTIKPRKRIFLASDLHLDHRNIIKYCKRPFKSVKHMNSVLVRNWNSVVKKNDVVYFLGDLAYGRGSRNTDYWFRRLNGKKVFIKGNHDRSRRIKFYKNLVLKYRGYSFLLTHYPQIKSWRGWIIHGHTHNHKGYPLLNRKRKRINVSCELTKYKPINLNNLINRIRE